jgi:hypothetical protein
MKTTDAVITIVAGGILAFVAYKTLTSGSSNSAAAAQRNSQAVLARTGNNKLAAIAQNVFTSAMPNAITGPLWPDTEASYQGTWTANGPLDLATYDKQIWD